MSDIGSHSRQTPPISAFELNEAVTLYEAATAPVINKPDGTQIELGYDGEGNLKEGGVFDEKGRVPVIVIRPGLGRGRGRHLYEAAMLEENASKFAGWKQYVDHLSPEARKAAGGLPRGVRDLGGRLQETWWDPSIPADDLHEAGAVLGMSRPTRQIRELIDDDPLLVEASISATATGVHPKMHGGQQAWCVEGINDRGSLDWVTEAGAGGRIAPLLESIYADEREVELALVESLDPDELREHLRARGQSTTPAARRTTEPPEGGDDHMEIKPEALAEALSASPTILVEAIGKSLTESAEVQAFVDKLVEAKLGDEREILEATAQARVDRAFELAGLERLAHKMIAESKLPESWQEGLRERYSLNENRPTDALNVENDLDDDGKVTKSAKDKLTESLEGDIKAERKRLAEANPTRVRGAGGSSELAEAAEPKEGEQPKDGPKPYWAEVLSEAGFEKPDEIYAGA
jgi:hypothetical protein